MCAREARDTRHIRRLGASSRLGHVVSSCKKEATTHVTVPNELRTIQFTLPRILGAGLPGRIEAALILTLCLTREKRSASMTFACGRSMVGGICLYIRSRPPATCMKVP